MNSGQGRSESAGLQVYLVEMAGTAALKKLLIAAHGNAERVDHLVPEALYTFQNVLVHAVEVLHSFLEDGEGA